MGNKLRLVLNLLIVILLATLIGIIIYLATNLKKLINKLLKTAITSVKNNESTIQPVIDSYTTTSAQNMVNKLNGTPLDTPFNQALSGKETATFKGGILQSVINNLLDDIKLQTKFENYAGNMIASKQVTDALNNQLEAVDWASLITGRADSGGIIPNISPPAPDDDGGDDAACGDANRIVVCERSAVQNAVRILPSANRNLRGRLSRNMGVDGGRSSPAKFCHRLCNE